MKIERFPDRASWLAARRNGIGGSDVPAILGISKWKTPLAVWTEKAGLAESPDEQTYVMARGNYMEPFIAEQLAKEAGITVSETGEDRVIVQHAEHPALLYSPDGFAWPGVGNDGIGDAKFLVEFKSRTPYSRDEWDGQVPADVLAQVQHGLDVCDLATAYVAVDLGSEFRWAKVDRDPTWASEQRPKLLAFWELVTNVEAPPPMAGDKDTLGRIFPHEQEGKTIALDGDVLDLAWELDGLKETVKHAETRADEIENLIRSKMGDAEKAVLIDGSGWTWKSQTRPKMVADKTQPPSEFRVMRRFKSKKEK